MKRIPVLVGEDPQPNPWDEEFAKGALSPAERSEIAKALSAAFGSRSKRRAQLVSRLKQTRTYDQPVRGGTGKQYRTRRKRFGKHADHDQSTHGNWAHGEGPIRVKLSQLVADVEPGDYESWEEGIAAMESETTTKQRLLDSVAAEGVKEPVIVFNGKLYSGHHRVWAAIRSGRDMEVPVLRAWDWAEAQDLMLEQAEQRDVWKRFGKSDV